MQKPILTIKTLKENAQKFCTKETEFENASLFGVNDGKAVITYIEHEFQEYLRTNYEIGIGSSAKVVDLPSAKINTDIKVTSIKQPQSSSPFKDAKQKIFGLVYNLLVFVYEKVDNNKTKTSRLNFVSCAFIEASRTADYTTTFRLREMIQDGANEEDIIAYLTDRNIAADEIALADIANQILQDTPRQGYLTISNALQWRLQHGRVVRLEEKIEGINKVIDKITS